MKDLIVRNCNLWNDDQTCIYIKKGIIQDIDPKIPELGCHEINANNNFVSSPFIDSHFHMDATLSYGLPRVMNQELFLRALNSGANSSQTLLKMLLNKEHLIYVNGLLQEVLFL